MKRKQCICIFQDLTLSFMLLSFILLFVPALAFGQDAITYSATLQQSEDEFSLKSIELVDGEGKNNVVPQGIQSYNLVIKDFKGNSLSEFDFPLIAFIADTAEQPGTTYHTLTFPYFSNAKSAIMSDSEGNILLTINLEDFATCNQDFVCDSGEDQIACPDDCRNAEEVREVNEIKKTSSKKNSPFSAGKEQENKEALFKTGIILAAILLLASIFYMFSKKTKDRP